MEPRRPQNHPPQSNRTRRSLFGRPRDGYENPSLERYSDLRFEKKTPRRRRWVIGLLSLIAFVMAVELALIGAVYWQARNDEARRTDAILVLGAAQWNGKPSPILQARLDHALKLYERGMAPAIIVTGGSVSGDIYTEGEVSEAYLAKRGVPEDKIYVEKEGRSTWESMQGVKPLAEKHNVKMVLIVSDGFHLFRAERMASAIGLKPYSSAAPDKDVASGSAKEFSFVIRETAAIWTQWPNWF